MTGWHVSSAAWERRRRFTGRFSARQSTLNHLFLSSSDSPPPTLSLLHQGGHYRQSVSSLNTQHGNALKAPLPVLGHSLAQLDWFISVLWPSDDLWARFNTTSFSPTKYISKSIKTTGGANLSKMNVYNVQVLYCSSTALKYSLEILLLSDFIEIWKAHI